MTTWPPGSSARLKIRGKQANTFYTNTFEAVALGNPGLGGEEMGVKGKVECPFCRRELEPDEIGDAYCMCGHRVTCSGSMVIGTKPLPDGWESTYADVLQG
jgi:hypothetical protein